jgi:hypothetical protein
MCNDFNWGSDDYDMREAQRNFKSAMVQQFNDLYGTDQNDLEAWRRLCRVLNIDPVPNGMKECREVSVLSTAFICIHTRTPLYLSLC